MSDESSGSERQTDDSGRSKDTWKSFTDEVEVSGQHLLAEINRLIAEGNVRKLVLKSSEGDVFLTVPLTAGAVAGGLVAISAPWLAIIAALAGLVARVRIEVVREPPQQDATPPELSDQDQSTA